MRTQLILALTIVCGWVKSTPVVINSEYDYPSAYQVEEEDLEDFAKLLDEYDEFNAENDSKAKVSTSGFKKKKTDSKGLNAKHDIKDLKKFYKSNNEKDHDNYDGEAVYAKVERKSSNDVKIKGNEDRKYRKGTKVRGFHRVHNKDEYKKDKTFYEDDETSGSISKVGDKEQGFNNAGGAGFKKGHYHHNKKQRQFGKKGFADNGEFDKEFKRFEDSQGFDSSFEN